MSAPFFYNQNMSVCLSVEEVQTILSLIAEEQIQQERDGELKSFSGVTAVEGGALYMTRE